MFSLVTGLPSTTSAVGVSAHFVRRLLTVLCPCSTPRRRACPDCAFGFPGRSGCLRRPGCRRGLSVLVRAVSRRADGCWTTPGLTKTRAIASASVAFPLGAFGRRPEFVFRSSIPRPSMPLSTLHLVPRGTRRKTRGQDGSLLLSCGELASPTARRFIPTIALLTGCSLGPALLRVPRVCSYLQSRAQRAPREGALAVANLPENV